MKLENLPEVNDPNAIFKFAMSFDGYAYYGSFEKCAEMAKARPRSSIEEIRNELFFEARASRHRGDDHYVAVYAELHQLLMSYFMP